jgi:hypothetical protein
MDTTPLQPPLALNLSDKKDERQAISYRFPRDDKGWRVLVSVSLPEVKHISDKKLG